jgi:hypothetical protein
VKLTGAFLGSLREGTRLDLLLKGLRQATQIGAELQRGERVALSLEGGYTLAFARDRANMSMVTPLAFFYTPEGTPVRLPQGTRLLEPAEVGTIRSIREG